MSINTIDATAGVTRTAALSHARTTSTAAHTHKRTWPTATKSAFYANFYAVDEATGAAIG
ncbi:MAG: hypothetical protein RLZZ364_828 [Actinomycetota bacterium]|jgi:hypothetical protein